MINFARVDDRFIHGQIVQGWLPSLDVEEVVLVAPGVEKLHQNLMRMSLPSEYDFQALDESAALQYCNASSKKIFLLFPELDAAASIIDKGLALKSLNIGGMHYREGREKILTDVYINPQEKEILKQLCAKGLILDGRSVPNEMECDIRGIICR